MELNDQGEYVAVEIQSKGDYKTGGVYMIRQVGVVSQTIIRMYYSVIYILMLLCYYNYSYNVHHGHVRAYMHVHTYRLYMYMLYTVSTCQYCTLLRIFYFFCSFVFVISIFP